jgi:heat shock protein HslJ
MIRYDYGCAKAMSAKLKSFVLTALLFAFVSLASGQQAQTDSVKSTTPASVTKKPGLTALKGKWFLLPALDSDTATGRVPEITLDITKGTFSGNTGCNRMSGTFLATDSTLSFSDKMVTSRMYCAGYNESAFLQNLLRVDSYKFKKGWLVFMVEGIEVFRWTRKQAVPKKTGKA